MSRALMRALLCAVVVAAACDHGLKSPDAGTPPQPVDGDAQPADGGKTCSGCGPCSSGAPLTAFEQSLIDLPPQTWWQAPASQMRTVCAPDALGVGGIDGCAGIILAWSGGAYDAVHRRMVIWGGGHDDYWGNELYGFDLRSGAWSRLTEPSVVPAGMASNDYFSRDPLPDGKPDARHTYDGLQFLEDGTFWAHGGSRAEDGHGTNLTWLYDDATGWTNVATTGTGPGGYSLSSGYDPASGRVLVHGAQLFYIYDVKAKTWSSLPGFGFPPLWPRYACAGDGTGAVDTKRGLFWSVGSGEVLVWDIANGAPVTDAWATTGGGAYTNKACVAANYPDQLFEGGGGAIYNVAAPGFDYDSAADALVAWPNAGAPYALDLKTRTWTAGGAAGAPTSKNSIGTYGRWRYIQAYNVFILVNSVDENVYFYKNTEGCGPP